MSARLIELIDHMPTAKVALIGDFMLDRYLFGRTTRISPEAPVPVLHFAREEQRLGGAGFVLAALATLGADVRATGLIGDDPSGVEIRRQVEQLGVASDGLLQSGNRPTVTKLRLLGSSQDRTPQQMIRLDYESPAVPDEAIAGRLLEIAGNAIDWADVICLEDYDKGVLTPALTGEIIRLARASNKPTLIDPANLSDYGKYAGATALKLNRPEAERATGATLNSPEQIRAAAERLLHDLDLQAVIITLNDMGAYLATADGESRLISTRPRQVADATGAGDQVLATLCMTRAAGATWVEAVSLANIASGLEVERLGCVPVTRAEIIHDLLAEQHANTGKTRTPDALLAELQHHRASGKKIVFTNGCFDILHLGHVKYFQFAKAQGDILVVGVNTDNSIRRLKGAKRPVMSEHDRLGVLEELESIDYLVLFDEPTPLQMIEAIKPEVLVKGADYEKQQVIGWETVEASGGRIALAPLVDGRSVSAVIQKIVDAYS